MSFRSFSQPASKAAAAIMSGKINPVNSLDFFIGGMLIKLVALEPLIVKRKGQMQVDIIFLYQSILQGTALANFGREIHFIESQRCTVVRQRNTKAESGRIFLNINVVDVQISILVNNA